MNFKESLKKFSKPKKIFVFVFVLLLITSILLLSKFIYDKVTEMAKASDNCIPYGVTVDSQSTSEAKITWKTDKNCISYVKYGLSLEELSYKSISNSSTKNHDATLTKLQSGFNYYYIIISDSKEYGINGLPLSFSTKSF